jgi:S1-C subfamily serine protease
VNPALQSGNPTVTLSGDLQNSALASVEGGIPTRSAIPVRQIPQAVSLSESGSIQENRDPAVTLGVSPAKQEQPELEEVRLDSNGLKSIHVAILERKKRQNLFFFVTNSLLALLTLLIGFALYRNISKPTPIQPPQAATPATTLVEDKVGSKEKSESAAQADQSAVQPTETAPVPENAAPPERPAFAFFSPKQISEIWKHIKPNLLELNIEGPYGKRKAVGLIVDSRGWLVTSYQAVKDASRIEVTAAIEPLNVKNGDAPLVDLVRGRVIDDPQNDLAILAINRRFVVSLAEVAISSQDRLVAEQRLLVAAPPSSTNYWGICEANVAQRCRVDQLPLLAKSRIELSRIGNAELSWLTMDGESEWLPGTPLLDQSGAVQAMVSLSLTTSPAVSSKSINKSIAVSVASLRALLKKATGTITPLASNVVQTNDGRSVFVPDDHPLKKRMVEMNLAALQCREFDWLPATADQYQQLADFAKNLVASKDFLLANEPDHRTPAAEAAAYEQVEKLIDALTEEISNRVGKALEQDQARLDAFNRLADQTIKGREDAFVPMYAVVTESGLRFDQFLVQIEGLETHCAIPFDPVARPLRPGTYWWLVLETKKSVSPQRIKFGDSGDILAYSAIRRFEIGPLEPK